ncbi:HTTM domain-containing protein [Mesonia ostreae]|uniref:HTTM domain-containing protein n=1 Tax=Mesonia ostreae TaxID=861110 RepID=A0ABU2KJD8_9FLAO|nr:HTTM domain-containing protein [Mesonia ostreae]MDT0294826.1 HTTM domain-containing protein [Mesonia ostreae]
MINKWLFKHIDNSALVLFRIFFGILLTLEAWGALFTGWIDRTLMAPQQTFNFIGFDFLQPLPGNGMYYYYFVMGIFGVMVTLGYKYRWSLSAFTVMWTCVYLMQKSSYNNHYYLLVLICLFMLLVPANANLSLDAKNNEKIRSISTPRWVHLFIILQLLIVYTYASFAKFYPDWLDGTVAEILMRSKKDYWLVGNILQEKWTHVTIIYFGILFDLLIVPLLLWKRTRTLMFIFAIFFHLFNSFVFRIGIFPYLSLAFCLFFFPTEIIHKRFKIRKEYYDKAEVLVPSRAGLMKAFFVAWFVIQISLPLRHWFIRGDVLHTEEGHRLSWRMMLRSKSGISTFKVVDKNTGESTIIKKSDYLSKKQLRTVSAKPDAIWQFAQRLKKEYAAKGQDVSVFVDAKISVNRGPYEQLTDSSVDLGSAKWDYFFHNEWILLPEEQ